MPARLALRFCEWKRNKAALLQKMALHPLGSLYNQGANASFKQGGGVHHTPSIHIHALVSRSILLHIKRPARSKGKTYFR